MKLSRPLLVRLAILVVLVAVAAALVFRTVPRMRRFRAVEAACSAIEDGDWSSALARSAGLTGPDPEGLRAAQCRCLALLQTGGQEACAGLLDGLIDDPRTGDWLPSPELTPSWSSGARAGASWARRRAVSSTAGRRRIRTTRCC